MDGEEFWMDNQWQKMGVYRLSTEDYIKHVYGNSNGKPWLLFLGKTPYGGPDGDFNTHLILFKRVACVKQVFGDDLNVGLIDVFHSEYIREAFDPDISRMGSGAPLVVFIKDGTAHHLKQGNHDAKFLARVVTEQEGVIQTEPTPYPVNSVTVYWEYIKMEAAKDRQIWGKLIKLIKKYDEDSPLLHRVIYPYFTDGSLYTYKQAGKRIIIFFFLPLILVAAVLLYVL